MGENTKISWCDATFNPWIGCEKVSEGCKHCYAEHGTTARVSLSRGLPLWGKDAGRQITSDANWRLPKRWNRAAQEAGERRRVFCASLADVFEDRPDLVEPREKLVSLINQTPWLDWLLLTKRPENMRRLAKAAGWAAAWPANVWAGTTAENQARYLERWSALAHVPARVRFISHEPALGPITIVEGLVGANEYAWPDWIITGGESGSKARPYSTDWPRRLLEEREQVLRLHGKEIAIFVKQLGANPVDAMAKYPGELAPLVLRDQKGGDWFEWPADLRVRQFPMVAP